MLAIDANKMPMTILLNGLPLRRLVLREAVEVNPVKAHPEGQDGQQQDYRRLPIMFKATMSDLVQHVCPGFWRERD